MQCTHSTVQYDDEMSAGHTCSLKISLFCAEPLRAAVVPVAAFEISMLLHAGLVWLRTRPQLVLLLAASTFSTVAAMIAQASTARLRQPDAAVPSQGQPVDPPNDFNDRGEQSSPELQRSSPLPWAIWKALSARFGPSTVSKASDDDAVRSEPASSLTPAATGMGLKRQAAHHATGNSQHSARSENGNSNGSGHERREDEWGRPIVHLHNIQPAVNHQLQTSERGQSGDSAASTVLWVRKDAEEQQIPASSTESKHDPQTVVWQRSEHRHAADDGDIAPRRFRRSRLGRHEVSVETLLDNVE